MRFYFLSDRPCALKLGGIYVGMTGGAEKFMDVDLGDGILCEFIPASPSYSPVTCVIDDTLKPNERLKEYFLPSAVALYAHDFLLADGSLRLIRQETYSDCTATLYAQGRAFACIENDRGTFTHPLPECFLRGNIYRGGDCIIFYCGSMLAVVSAAGEMQFITHVSSCSFSPALKAEIPVFDCARHNIKVEWILSDRAERVSYSARPTLQPGAAAVFLALVESLMYGFDVSPYVTEELGKKTAALKEFLGDYEEALYLGENVAGLAYKREENACTVIPFTADLLNGRVDNVREYGGEE